MEGYGTNIKSQYQCMVCNHGGIHGRTQCENADDIGGPIDCSSSTNSCVKKIAKGK